MARAWAIVLVTLLLTVGCLGANEGEPASLSQADPDQSGDGTASPDDRTAASGTTESTPTGMDPLATAPTWQTGEWWEIKLTSPLIDHEVTWTRVVAGTEGEDYLVGQPRDTWSAEGILFHFPGMGEVAMEDLSFEAHDGRFHPVQFPLTEGKEWETSYEAAPVTAQVTSVDGETAELWYCCGRNVTATYDASLGAISHMEADGLLTYEVIDHGYDFEGVVTVPHGHDLVFNHGRIASVLDFTLQPAPPVEDVELSDDYGRVTFAGIVGDIQPVAPPAQLPLGTGAYVERVTAPDGTTYETQRLPDQGPGLTVEVYETTELGGTWTMEHAAAGAGISFTEGIAYHVFDMQLPEGHLLGDHSEHVT